MPKANHEVKVVSIGEIFPHPNADKLELTKVGGYQVVIGKGNFKQGDLAVYIQPDSIVPQAAAFKFIWAEHIGIDGVVPEKRRRITVKRLRKEYSEGLLMPLSDLYDSNLKPVEGDEVSEVLGITHYVPEFDKPNTSAVSTANPKRRWPKTARGWFFFLARKIGFRNAGGRSYAEEVSFQFPVYDVDSIKNHPTWIEPGEQVHVTEKIHGSNARYVYVDGHFYAGSHFQWKLKGDNVWWNVAKAYPEIEEWCTQNPGLVLYGEVGPTQDGYRYSAGANEVFWFAFDVYDPANNLWLWPGNIGVPNTVPVLYRGAYDAATIASYVDGQSTVGKNRREGIVIRSITNPRNHLKLVSNAFLEGDSK